MQSGVEAYAICNRSGQVLRRSSSFTVDEAEVFSQAMISLSNQARSAIRDLNPKVFSSNETDRFIVKISCRMI